VAIWINNNAENELLAHHSRTNPCSFLHLLLQTSYTLTEKILYWSTFVFFDSYYAFSPTVEFIHQH